MTGRIREGLTNWQALGHEFELQRHFCRSTEFLENDSQG